MRSLGLHLHLVLGFLCWFGYSDADVDECFSFYPSARGSVGESVSISGPVLLTAGPVDISSCYIKAVREEDVPTRQLFKEGRGRQKKHACFGLNQECGWPSVIGTVA